MGNCISGDRTVERSQSNQAPGFTKKSEEQSDSMDNLPFDPEIGSYLKNVPLLIQLSDDERAKLGGALIERKYDGNQNIISQGDEGTSFFIISKGKAVVTRVDPDTKQKSEIAILNEGDYFGEAALLNNDRRQATITATEETICLTLEKEMFAKLFGKDRLNIQFAKRNAVSAEQMREMAKTIDVKQQKLQSKSKADSKTISTGIRENVLFSNLSEDQLAEIVQKMYLVKIAADSEVIKQGDVGDNFYVVKSGSFEVSVSKNGSTSQVVSTCSTGDSFGELALMYNSPRAATVKALVKGELWALDRHTFRRILVKVSNNRLEEFESFLKTVPILATLISTERSRVAEALESVEFKKGSTVVEQGDEGDTFFIIRSGKVSVKKREKDGSVTDLGNLERGDFFGERSLLKDEPRAATVKAIEDVECLILERKSFSLLMGPLEDLMRRKIDEYDGIGSEPAKASALSPFLDIKFEDLILMGTLGRGSFGHVQLAKDRKSGKTFALKEVRKAQIVHLGQQEHIMSEKKVMASLNHPFLINLRQTFKDEESLFFLLELCLGGELFTVLRARTAFDEKTARFYAGCVILAFEHMHDHDIIYRDLKPENLMVNDDGYLKVTDFGFAKVVPDRTWTLCGTPDYLAPEVVSGQGHGKGVDWWTLGILIYEMLASYPPFYDDDPMRTYSKIMYGSVNYPKHFSKEAVNLIQKLLHPKATKRLGVLKGGATLIKEHPWFRGFDWDALYNRKLKAPIIPKISSPEDMSNFDEYPDEEEEEFPPYEDDGSNWDADF